MNKLEEYCISLPQGKRQRLITLLKASLQLDEKKDKTFCLMHEAMVKVMGKEVLVKSRNRDLVIGRTLLAYSCAVLGWTECTIGEYLQRDHSSVNKMKRDVEHWLNHPLMFGKENNLYVEFLKEWNNEIDK